MSETRSIAEIYERNDGIRADLVETASKFSEEQTREVPDGEKWSLVHLLEHLARAEEGMSKAAYFLLKKDRDSGGGSDGSANLTPNYYEKSVELKGQKFKAPESVDPTGEWSREDALEKLDANRKRLADLREMYDTVEVGANTFPHPAFGPMNAHEWLAFIGDHEERHLAQIKRLYDKLT